MWNVADPLFVAAIGLVALLYSSVGHGGASGYLALMGMTALSGRPSSTLALAMNLGVASIAFTAYHRGRYFRSELALPLLLGSVPAAFLGGRIPVAPGVHSTLIAIALIAAAAALLTGSGTGPESLRQPRSDQLFAIGAFLGLASGIVGIGGGVFLSPILLLFRWADAKQTSSVAALFIVANSLAALAARSSVELAVVGQHWPLVTAAVAGSLAGSSIGAFRATRPQLRKLLAVVLAIAAIKLI